MLRNGLTLAGYIALLVAFSPWLVLVLLLATVPAFAAEASFSAAGFRLRNWRAPESRKLNYLEYVMANDEHAKEVKLFGLGRLLLGRYRRLAETIFDEDRRLAIRRTSWGWSLSLLSTLAFYGCYALIVSGHGPAAAVAGGHDPVPGRLPPGPAELPVHPLRRRRHVRGHPVHVEPVRVPGHPRR